MEESKAKSTADIIFKDVFGVDNPWSLEELRAIFCDDVDLPKKVSCEWSGKETWVYNPQQGNKFVNQDVLVDKIKDTGLMFNKRPIDSMGDVLKYWGEVNYMTAEKVLSSQEVSCSDSVTSSSSVIYSSLIGSSKNIILSSNIFNSNYLLASKGSNSCNMGIRMFDSLYCTSSYEVRWANKISKSMFITDSLDLFECMFCYGIRSKKYCIANMQYEKDEYLKIKKMVIDELIKNKFTLPV